MIRAYSWLMLMDYTWQGLGRHMGYWGFNRDQLASALLTTLSYQSQNEWLFMKNCSEDGSFSYVLPWVLPHRRNKCPRCYADGQQARDQIWQGSLSDPSCLHLPLTAGMFQVPVCAQHWGLVRSAAQECCMHCFGNSRSAKPVGITGFIGEALLGRKALPRSSAKAPCQGEPQEKLPKGS